MELTFDIWSVLLTFGVMQGIFLSIIIFTTSKKRTSSVLLICLVLIAVLNLADYLVIHSNLYVSFPHLVFVPLPLLFLIGPIYYFYVGSLRIERTAFKWKYLLHGIPFIFSIFFFNFFYSLSADAKIATLSSLKLGDGFELPIKTIGYMAVHTTQILIYVVFIARLLNREMRLNGLTPSRVSFLNSLSMFNKYFAGYWILTFLILILFSSVKRFFVELDYIVMLNTTMLINSLMYVAAGKNKFFMNVFLSNSGEKYSKGTKSHHELKKVLQHVVRCMQDEKLYLNPELKLSDLATKLNVSSNVLSQAINQLTGKKFHDFLNEYRFKEMKARLSEPDSTKLTIFGIAQESGFNNKYTYTKVFKSYTGMTPSEYVKDSPEALE